MGREQGKEEPRKKPQELGQMNFLAIISGSSASKQILIAQQGDPLCPESFLEGDLSEMGLGQENASY